MLQSHSTGRLLDEPLRRMVTRRVIGVIAGTPISVGVGRMIEFDIGFLAITEAGKVIGYITDAEIKKAVAQGVPMDSPIEEIMAPEPLSVDINTPVREVLEFMSEKRARYLIVTSGSEVEGIVTLKDLEDITRQRIETYISRE